jgi:hypothetical protein
MHLSSDTAIEFQINKKQNCSTEKELHQLEKQQEIIAARVDQLRKFLKGHYNNFFQYIKKLRKGIEKFQAGNCGEMALLAQAEIIEAGKKANLVYLNVKDKLTGKDLPSKQHTFVLMNLNDDGIVKSPETWDEDAIIVDPWSGIAKRANQGLKAILKLFDIDTKKHEVILNDEDLFDMDNLI